MPGVYRLWKTMSVLYLIDVRHVPDPALSLSAQRLEVVMLPSIGRRFSDVSVPKIISKLSFQTSFVDLYFTHIFLFTEIGSNKFKYI